MAGSLPSKSAMSVSPPETFSSYVFRVLLWVLVVFFVSEARADPSDCPPSVEVEGEVAIVSEVRKLLAARGIALEAKGACPAIIARIEWHDAMYRLKIQDVYGRTSERFVAGAETAATLLESWARTDLSAPLLATRLLPEPPTPTSEPASIPAAPPAFEEEGDSLAPTPEKSLWGVADPNALSAITALKSNLSVSMELSLGTNGSLGFGPRVSSCVLLGGICMGFLGRLVNEDEIALPRLLSDARYLSGELLFAIDFYTEPGALSVVPGLAFGGGFVRLLESRGPVVREQGALRADAHVLFLVPFASWLDLDLGISAGLASPSLGEVGGVSDGARFYLRGSMGFRWKP